MYPIKINLLSNEKRKYLNRMIYIQFVKNTFISIVFVFCLSGMTLLGGQSVLQEYFNSVSSVLTMSNSVRSAENKQIQDVNNIIKRTEALEAVNNLWAEKIVEFGNAVPAGVTIKNMGIFKDRNEINISGLAQNRDALLELKENVSELDFIENMEIPLSQLTEKEDINFSITIKMK